MSSVTYTSGVTVERIPSPSTHKFNACYIAQAEERTEITEQEESYVEELCDLIQHYRHEYARLTNEIRRSRTRFNAVAYISRLPEELLATIFETYVADHWEQYYPLENPARRWTADRVTPYQWIKGVLHVCGQWRRVALSTPLLWTYIAYDKLYEDWRLNFLLEHAGNLPLTLRNDRDLHEDPYRPKQHLDPEDLYEYTPSGSGFFEQVMQGSFARIGTLALTTFEQVDFLNLFGNRDKGGDGDESSDGDGDSDGIKDSSEDEGGDDNAKHNDSGNKDERALVTPLMRHLLLDLSVGHWRSPLFRNLNVPYLRSLLLNKAPLELVQRLSCSSLTRLDVAFNSQVLPSELSDLLKNMPTLRQLMVNPVASEDVQGDYNTPQMTVTLPSLESLRIGGTAFGVTQLLNQLRFPVNALISLHPESFSPSLLSSIMPTVLGHTASSADTLSLTEREHYVSPHAITLWSEDGQYAYMKAYFWRKSSPARASWIAGDSDPAILSSLQPPTPERSWVQCDDARLFIACDTELGALMDQLEILDMSQVLSLTLTQVLLPICETPHGLLGRPPVFPRLGTLHLSDSVIFWSDVRKLLQWIISPAQATTTISPVPVEVDCDGSPLVIGSVGSAKNTSIHLPLPSLKTLILPKLILRRDDVDQPDSIDGDGIFAWLRRCAQVGYKLELLKFACGRVFYKTNMTSTAFRDALLKTGFADVVEMTGW